MKMKVVPEIKEKSCVANSFQNFFGEKFGRWVKVASLIPFHQHMTKNFKQYPYRKQNILNIWPLFGHFWDNCRAAYIFTRPLLSYAAEESPVGNTWKISRRGPIKNFRFKNRDVTALFLKVMHCWVMLIGSLQDRPSCSTRIWRLAH